MIEIRHNKKRGELPEDWDILRNGELIACVFTTEAEAKYIKDCLEELEEEGT